MLSFSGFMRFDEVSAIKRRKIQFAKDHIKVIIPESKGDIYRDGESVSIARVGGKLCPVAAVEAYI